MNSDIYKVLLKHVNSKETDLNGLISDLIKLKSAASPELSKVLSRGITDLADWRINFKAGFPTGISQLDFMLEGGLRRCELGLIAGPPESGKTRTLVNFAAVALNAGKRVLFVTLEQPWDQIRNFITMATYDLYESEILWKHKRKIKLMEKAGLLQPVDLSAAPCKINELHQLLYQVDNFDIAYIDYLDLISPVYKQEIWRHDIDMIYHELSLITKELKVAIWTATQGTAESVKYGIKDITGLSEGKIAKSKHIAIGIGLNPSYNQVSQSFSVFKKRRKSSAIRLASYRIGKYKLFG